jgi:hypothetical protein
MIAAKWSRLATLFVFFSFSFFLSFFEKKSKCVLRCKEEEEKKKG